MEAERETGRRHIIMAYPIEDFPEPELYPDFLEFCIREWMAGNPYVTEYYESWAAQCAELD
jgi:hypothetical protein